MNVPLHALRTNPRTNRRRVVTEAEADELKRPVLNYAPPARRRRGQLTTVAVWTAAAAFWALLLFLVAYFLFAPRQVIGLGHSDSSRWSSS